MCVYIHIYIYTHIDLSLSLYLSRTSGYGGAVSGPVGCWQDCKTRDLCGFKLYVIMGRGVDKQDLYVKGVLCFLKLPLAHVFRGTAQGPRLGLPTLCMVCSIGVNNDCWRPGAHGWGPLC